jgi:hypothetical protein
MAWIEKKREGFRARWRDAKGKVHAGPTFATKDEAGAWAIATGHAEPPKHNLVELLEDFCTSRIAERGIQVTYSRDLRQRLPSVFLARGWTTADQITVAEIDRWWRDTSGTGLRRPLAQILSLLRWAFHHRDVSVPAKVLTYRAPRQARKVKDAELLNGDQVRLILEAGAAFPPTDQERGRPAISWRGFNAHLVALLHYLSTYGARPATACKLTIGQIDFAAGTLTLTAKRSGEWRHPLRDDTLQYFAAIVAGREHKQDAPLFLNFHQKPWKLTPAGEADQLAWWYHKHIGSHLRLGKLARVYHLKRYAISTMRAAGADAETVAKFTGHLTTAQVDGKATVAINSVVEEISVDAVRGRMTVKTVLPPPPAALGGGAASPSAGGTPSLALGGTLAQAVQFAQREVAELKQDTQRLPCIIPRSDPSPIKIRWVVIDKGNTLETSEDGVKYVASVTSVPSAYDPDTTSSFIDGIGRGTLFEDGVAQEGYVLVVNDDSGATRNAVLTGDVVWVVEPRNMPVGSGPQTVQVYPFG